MSGGGRRAGQRRKAASRVSVPKKLASKLPVKQAQANRLAGWAFGLFVLAIAGVALVALDVPAKVGARRRRGGRRRRLPGEERRRPAASSGWTRGRSMSIALDQKTTAMPLVDVADDPQAAARISAGSRMRACRGASPTRW